MTSTLQLALDAVKCDFMLSTAEAKALMAEIDRLRAALERIVATESVDNDGEPVPETGAAFLAREALK